MSYIYYKTGWASNITIKDEYVDPSTTPGDPDDYDWARDLALYYYSHGDLRLALLGKYEGDPNGDPVDGTYETEHAREFRYEWVVGGLGERYLTVDYDPDPSESGPYAADNPFRFSTRYWNDETGLGYWG